MSRKWSAAWVGFFLISLLFFQPRGVGVAHPVQKVLTVCFSHLWETLVFLTTLFQSDALWVIEAYLTVLRLRPAFSEALHHLGIQPSLVKMPSKIVLGIVLTQADISIRQNSDGIAAVCHALVESYILP